MATLQTNRTSVDKDQLQQMLAGMVDKPTSSRAENAHRGSSDITIVNVYDNHHQTMDVLDSNTNSQIVFKEKKYRSRKEFLKD
jgi:hypothetical protein